MESFLQTPFKLFERGRTAFGGKTPRPASAGAPDILETFLISKACTNHGVLGAERPKRT